MRKQRTRIIIGFAGLTSALFVLIILNILSGTMHITVSQIAEAVSGRAENTVVRDIVRDTRLPRILTAVFLGGALALSGYLLQVFFANPIAGPFILGISSGAKLTLSLTLIAFTGCGLSVTSLTLIIAAFAGSLLSMGFVLALSAKVKNMSMLIICGVMIGYICSAITDFVLTFADDSNIVNLHNWLQGSFSGISWSYVAVMAVVVSISLFFCILLVKPMSAYRLGEVYAKNMGVNIRAFRIALILLSSILSACVTAFAGPISFVGVAVPHLIRSIFRTSKPVVLVPACTLGGAAFCLLCDLIARCAFQNHELMISSVTAIFGAPIVIIAMIGRKQREG